MLASTTYFLMCAIFLVRANEFSNLNYSFEPLILNPFALNQQNRYKLLPLTKNVSELNDNYATNSINFERLNRFLDLSANYNESNNQLLKIPKLLIDSRNQILQVLQNKPIFENKTFEYNPLLKKNKTEINDDDCGNTTINQDFFACFMISNLKEHVRKRRYSVNHLKASSVDLHPKTLLNWFKNLNPRSLGWPRMKQTLEKYDKNVHDKNKKIGSWYRRHIKPRLDYPFRLTIPKFPTKKVAFWPKWSTSKLIPKDVDIIYKI